MFDRFFPASPIRESANIGPQPRFELSPRVDVSEDKKTYHLSLEPPRLDGDDLTATEQENALIVQGEKKTRTVSEDQNFHLTERTFGTFKRTFRLPTDT